MSQTRQVHGTLLRRPLNGDATRWTYVSAERAEWVLRGHRGMIGRLALDPGLEAVIGQWVYRFMPTAQIRETVH